MYQALFFFPSRAKETKKQKKKKRLISGYIFPRNIIKIDWHDSPLSKLRNRKFAKSVLRNGSSDGFQVTWNFLESFQLSDFSEMQSKVIWDFT